MDLTLISYDIPDDKRRLKVANCLEDFGDRVQYSVFEARLSIEETQELCERLIQRIDPQEDSIRIYRVCGNCEGRIQILGKGEVRQEPDVYIF